LTTAATAFIDPGAPWQNPAFNARVRDELLDVEQFSCLAGAVVVIGDWREDYNIRRPHSALAMQTPDVAQACPHATLTRPGPANGSGHRRVRRAHAHLPRTRRA
jgi:transposase InsO family protein